MRFLTAIFLVFFGFVSQTFSQTIDTVSITKTLKGNLYFYRGEEIKPNDLSVMMENYEEAFDVFESSREAYFFGSLFVILGTGLIIFPVSANAVGYNVNWGYAYTGIGFLGITVPIYRNYQKKSTEAIYLYNQAIQQSQKQTEVTSFNFGTTPNGIGFQLNF